MLTREGQFYICQRINRSAINEMIMSYPCPKKSISLKPNFSVRIFASEQTWWSKNWYLLTSKRIGNFFHSLFSHLYWQVVSKIPLLRSIKAFNKDDMHYAIYYYEKITSHLMQRQFNIGLLLFSRRLWQIMLQHNLLGSLQWLWLLNTHSHPKRMS